MVLRLSEGLGLTLPAQYLGVGNQLVAFLNAPDSANLKEITEAWTWKKCDLKILRFARMDPRSFGYFDLSDVELISLRIAEVVIRAVALGEWPSLATIFSGQDRYASKNPERPARFNGVTEGEDFHVDEGNRCIGFLDSGAECASDLVCEA